MKHLVVAPDGTVYTSLVVFVISSNIVSLNWFWGNTAELLHLITEVIPDIFTAWSKPEIGIGRSVEFIHTDTNQVTWVYDPATFTDSEKADIQKAAKLLENCLKSL